MQHVSTKHLSTPAIYHQFLCQSMQELHTLHNLW